LYRVEVILQPSQRPIDSIVLADIFLDFEPMRDGLIANPLSKAFWAEEEGCLRLGDLV
jgi:hypothetical protein